MSAAPGVGWTAVRIGYLSSHPIQYQVPWFRELARQVELEVFFALRPNADLHVGAGFGVAFDWDVDLLGGYRHRFLANRAKRPGTGHFLGCDTPEIGTLIANGRYDAFVINGWSLKSYGQALSACRRSRVPAFIRGDSQLTTPRSRFKKVTKELTYPWLVRSYSGALCPGARNRDYLAYYGMPQSRLFHVPYSVDITRFARTAEEARGRRAALRAQWGIAPDEVVALFVGRLLPIKSPMDLLEALRHLDHGRRIRAVFAGDGPLRDDIVRAGQDLLRRPVMLGFQNQSVLPAVYAMADFLVLPSASETWGLVVNEAMACGLPAVVSDGAGCAPDLIEPGRTGQIYKGGDTRALANAMAEMLPLLGSEDVTNALRAKVAECSPEEAARAAVRAFAQVCQCSQ